MLRTVIRSRTVALGAAERHDRGFCADLDGGARQPSYCVLSIDPDIKFDRSSGDQSRHYVNYIAVPFRSVR